MKDNTSSENDKVISEVVNLANGILEERIDIIEGCRRLSVLRHGIDGYNAEFLPFRGVASETDDFPIGEERNTWSAEALARMDSEREAYAIQMRKPIMQACKKLIETF